MFNTRFIGVASRAKAAGMSDPQIAFLCGVTVNTVARWKNNYPEFGRACKEGTAVATQTLISKGLQAAGGYQAKEIKEEYTTEDGKETLTKRTVKTKDVAPNANLLMFFLTNMAPESFRNLKEINVNNTNVTIDITESERIKELCGHLVKRVENTAEKAPKELQGELI